MDYNKVPSSNFLGKASFWEKDSFLSPTDFLIVGSGIVGLSAAIRLKELQPTASVTIIERGPLPSGASTKNAGFACFGSLSELLDDLEQQTEEEIISLVELRWRGLQRLRKRISDQGLQYLEYGGFEVFKTSENFDICVDKLPYFNKLLKKITQSANTFSIADKQLNNLNFKGIEHLIVNNCEGQIHTGKMMSALLSIAQEKNIRIINGTGVQKFEDQGDRVLLLLENGWEVMTKKLLIATNGFSPRLLPDVDVQAARNQVLVTKPIENLPIKGCFHFDKGYVYFRNIGNRILLGGGRNQAPQAETTDQFGRSEAIQSYLLELLEQHFLPDQEINIDYWWSGIMGVGAQKRPIIKQLSNNVAISVRLGGMGVAIGTLVGEQGAELLLS